MTTEVESKTLSPSEFAGTLKLLYAIPPPTASTAKKQEWLGRILNTRSVLALPTRDVEKVFKKAVAACRDALIAHLDKMQHCYVGFGDMTWEEYREATVDCLFSARDDGDGRHLKEVARIRDRAKGRFAGIIKRELREGNRFRRWSLDLINMGAKMETTIATIAAVNDELKRAKQEMQDLANEVTTMSELVSVKLAKQLESIRNKRVAVTMELQDVLAPLKALRAFFDDGGDHDVSRLEKLNALCAQLEGFHRSGALPGLVTALEAISRAPHEG